MHSNVDLRKLPSRYSLRYILFVSRDQSCAYREDLPVYHGLLAWPSQLIFANHATPTSSPSDIFLQRALVLGFLIFETYMKIQSNLACFPRVITLPLTFAIFSAYVSFATS